MKHAFTPLGELASARLRETSLAFRQDEFVAAEAEADAAFHDVADFALSAKFSRKDAVEKMAALNMIAHEAEQQRQRARHRLLLEWCDYLKANLPGEGKP